MMDSGFELTEIPGEKKECKKILEKILGLIAQFATGDYTPGGVSILQKKVDTNTVERADIFRASQILSELITANNESLERLIQGIEGGDAANPHNITFNLAKLNRLIGIKLAENRGLHELMQERERVLARLAKKGINVATHTNLHSMIEKLGSNHDRDINLEILRLLDLQQKAIYLKTPFLSELLTFESVNYNAILDKDLEGLVREKKQLLYEAQNDSVALIALYAKIEELRTLAQNLDIAIEELPSPYSPSDDGTILPLKQLIVNYKQYYTRLLTTVQSSCLAHLHNTRTLSAMGDEIDDVLRHYGKSSDADAGLSHLCQALKDLKTPEAVFPAELRSSVAHIDMFMDIILELQAQIDAQNQEKTEITGLKQTLNDAIRQLGSLSSRKLLLLADASDGQEVDAALVDLDTQISKTDTLVQATIERLNTHGIVHIDKSYTEVYEALQRNLQLELTQARRKERELTSVNQGLRLALEDQRLAFSSLRASHKALKVSQAKDLAAIQRTLSGSPGVPMRIGEICTAITASKERIADLTQRLRNRLAQNHARLRPHLDAIREKLEASLREKELPPHFTSERFNDENPLYLLELTLILETLLGEHKSLKFTPKWKPTDGTITLNLGDIKTHLNALSINNPQKVQHNLNAIYSISFNLFMGKQTVAKDDLKTLAQYTELETLINEKIKAVKAALGAYKLQIQTEIQAQLEASYRETSQLYTAVQALARHYDREPSLPPMEGPPRLDHSELGSLTDIQEINQLREKLKAATKAYEGEQKELQRQLFQNYLDMQIAELNRGLSKLGLTPQGGSLDLAEPAEIMENLAPNGTSYPPTRMPAILNALKALPYSPDHKSQIDTLVGKTLRRIDAAFQEKFDEVQAENAAFRHANEDLRSEVQHLAAALTLNQLHNQTLDARNQALNIELKNLSREKSLSEEELALAREKLKERIAINEKQDTQLKRYRDQFEAFESKITELTAHNEGLARQIDELQGELSNSDAANLDLDEKLQILQASYAENQEELARSEHEVLLSKIEYELSLRKQAEQTASIHAQTEEIYHLNEQLGTSTAKNKVLLGALKKQKRRIKKYRSEYQTHVMQLQAQLAEEGRKISGLEAHLARNSKVIENQEKLIAEKTHDNRILHSEIVSLRMQFASTDGRNEDLELQLSVLQAQFNENRTSLTTLSKTHEKTLAENKDLKAQLARKQEYSGVLGSKLILLEEALTEKERENLKLRGELASLKEQFERENHALSAKLDDSKESIRWIEGLNAELSRQIDELKIRFSEDLSGYEREKAALLEQLGNQQALIQRQQQALVDSDEQLQDSKRLNQDLIDRNQVLEAKISELEEMLQGSGVDNEGLREELDVYIQESEATQGLIAANKASIDFQHHELLQQAGFIRRQADQIKQLKESLRISDREKGFLRQRLHTLTQELECLQDDIDDFAARERELQSDISKLRQAIKRASAQRAQDEVEIAGFQEALGKQERMIADQIESLKQKNQEIESLREELEAAGERDETQAATIERQQAKIHQLIIANTQLLGQVHDLLSQEESVEEGVEMMGGTNSDRQPSHESFFESKSLESVDAAREPSYEIFAHERQPENCGTIEAINRNNLNPEAITLRKNQITEVFSPSGQAYQFRITDTQSVATLQKIGRSKDEFSQQKLALTTINILQNVLLNHDVIHLNTKNADIMTYAKHFIVFLNKKHELELKLIINGKEVGLEELPKNKIFNNLDESALAPGKWHSAFATRHDIELGDYLSRRSWGSF